MDEDIERLIRKVYYDDIFNYHIYKAILLLVEYSGGRLKNISHLHKSSFEIGRLIKYLFKPFYERLRAKKLCENTEIFLKLYDATLEQMCVNMYDEDFDNVFQILETLYNRDYYIEILRTHSTGVCVETLKLEIDVSTHTITKI